MLNVMYELHNINHNASIGKVYEDTSSPFVFYQVFFRVNHQNSQHVNIQQKTLAGVLTIFFYGLKITSILSVKGSRITRPLPLSQRKRS